MQKEMAKAYDKSEITMHGSSLTLPDKDEIISILGDIKKLMFPAYFASGEAKGDAITFCEPLLYSIYGRIKKQISLALSFKEKEKNWIEKQVAIHSKDFGAPFGISEILYGFTVKGRIKKT